MQGFTHILLALLKNTMHYLLLILCGYFLLFMACIVGFILAVEFYGHDLGILVWFTSLTLKTLTCEEKKQKRAIQNINVQLRVYDNVQ